MCGNMYADLIIYCYSKLEDGKYITGNITKSMYIPFSYEVLMAVRISVLVFWDITVWQMGTNVWEVYVTSIFKVEVEDGNITFLWNTGNHLLS